MSQHVSPFSKQLWALALLSELLTFATELVALALIPTLINLFYTIKGPGTLPNLSHLILHNYWTWPSSQPF